MKAALELLKQVTEKWPSPKDSCHVLFVKDGRLHLYLDSTKACFQPVEFSEADLDKPPEEIVRELAELMDTANALHHPT
jgi:hypothetical protein